MDNKHKLHLYRVLVSELLIAKHMGNVNKEYATLAKLTELYDEDMEDVNLELEVKHESHKSLFNYKNETEVE